MIENKSVQQVLFFVLAGFCLTPVVDAPIALVLGIILAIFIGNPFVQQSGKIAKKLLKISIVGLGFGMNFYSAIHAGKDGFIFTVFTIILVLVLGWLLGKWLKIDNKTSYLVSSGTAICGGSAIAAVGPTIDADEKQMSVALGTVFILNSVALLIFPAIGHQLHMTQHQFGIWCAIAIHDTSSVVGAAQKYGDEALKLATTIKLGRALWIIPLTLLTALFQKGGKKKISIPYFIGFFILAMLISTFTPQFNSIYAVIAFWAKKLLVLTLFLIGAGLSMKVVKSVGLKTFVQGIILWITISVVVLTVVISIE